MKFRNSENERILATKSKSIQYNIVKDSIIDFIKKDWTFIQCIPTEHWNKELALNVVNISGNYYKYLPEHLQQNLEIINDSLNNDENVIRYISPYFLDQLSMDMVRKIINKNGNLLKFLDWKYRNNYEIAKDAICNSGNAWFYISKQLQLNIKLFELALCKTPSIMQHIIQNKNQNKEILKVIFGEQDGIQIFLPFLIQDRKIVKDECIICFEHKELINLECHSSHNLCITCLTLIQNKKCPLCRKQFKLPKKIDFKIWS
jgi:hypothetical protein